MRFTHFHLFLVYNYYPKKTCGGNERGRYKTLSEAKAACAKDGACEMVSKVCEDCGTPKQKQSYYRACSGDFWEPVNDYGRMLAEYFETWIKGFFTNTLLMNLTDKQILESYF